MPRFDVRMVVGDLALHPHLPTSWPPSCLNRAGVCERLLMDGPLAIPKYTTSNCSTCSRSPPIPQSRTCETWSCSQTAPVTARMSAELLGAAVAGRTRTHDAVARRGQEAAASRDCCRHDCCLESAERTSQLRRAESSGSGYSGWRMTLGRA